MNPIEKQNCGVMMSQLLGEIRDKSIERILRGVIFGGKDIREVIKEERPETIKTNSN